MLRTLVCMWGLLLSPLTVAAPLMYVPATNELVVIDLETDRVIDRIGELENAHGLAANANTEYLVAGSMQPLEGAAGRKMVTPGEVSEEEHAAHHGEDSDEIVMASYLSIIHPKHGHVMRRIPVSALTHHAEIAPDGKYAIAVHSGAGGISVVDLQGMSLVKTVQTGRQPNYAVFSPDGERLYVSNAGDGTVSELDGASWEELREFKVGGAPEHMVLSADGSTLFVADVAGAVAVVVKLPGGEVAKRFAVGKEPHGIDVSADGRRLFVSSKGENRINRIDLVADEIVSMELAPAPYHVEYVDALGKLYVSSRQLPKIWVLDPVSLKVVSEIDIGQGVAHQMVLVTWR